MSATPQSAARRVAVLDGGSFALPYDAQLVRMLARHGVPVDLFASRTRYNGDLLTRLADVPGVVVHAADVSGSVVSRWRGVRAYLGLLIRLARRSRRYSVINLQFSVLWPLELPFLFAWRGSFVFTVHNPVPHGFEGLRHRPTEWIARCARALVFVSEFSRDDFLRRYGERFRAKSQVVAHGMLPIADADAPVPYRPLVAPKSIVFWGNVQPYKGVDIFLALARSPAVRARGIALEIHGAWSPAMHSLRDELRSLGVTIVDGFLDAAALRTLLSRDAVFLLPYTRASQSGALYTLLHQGRSVVCSDVGDLGDFMRRFGLDGLLLKERSAAAVLDCLDRLSADADADADGVRCAFDRAQRASDWEAVWPAAERVYATPDDAGRDATIARRQA